MDVIQPTDEESSAIASFERSVVESFGRNPAGRGGDGEDRAIFLAEYLQLHGLKAKPVVVRDRMGAFLALVRLPSGAVVTSRGVAFERPASDLSVGSLLGWAKEFVRRDEEAERPGILEAQRIHGELLMRRDRGNDVPSRPSLSTELLGGILLQDLQSETWELAIAMKGAPLTDAEECPRVEFHPGIADYGTWRCCVKLAHRAPLKDHDGTYISGTIGSCLVQVRAMLAAHRNGQ